MMELRMEVEELTMRNATLQTIKENNEKVEDARLKQKVRVSLASLQTANAFLRSAPSSP